MALLYADEDFDHLVVELLRDLGHDVLTAFEAGQANHCVPDSLVLSFATTAGRSLLTFNRRHFIRLHRQSSDHAGIIVCSRDDDSAAIAARIHQVLTTNRQLAQQLFRVNRPG